MTSSASFPFKLAGLQVKENDRFVLKNCKHFARFNFIDLNVNYSMTSAQDVLGVIGVIELSPHSWLEPMNLGVAFRIGEFMAKIENASFDHRWPHADPPTYDDATWFACRELNPMLESFTTLFGIRHNIDVQVEHGLRPVDKLLRGLVAPKPGHIKFKTKGRYNL